MMILNGLLETTQDIIYPVLIVDTIRLSNSKIMLKKLLDFS
jgi:hypothetical protein